MTKNIIDDFLIGILAKHVMPIVVSELESSEEEAKKALGEFFKAMPELQKWNKSGESMREYTYYPKFNADPDDFRAHAYAIASMKFGLDVRWQRDEDGMILMSVLNTAKPEFTRILREEKVKSQSESI